MRDTQNLHLKVQELCDCYATTDPLKEMSDLPGDEDVQEAALKWLALAVLHGVNDNARQISLSLSEQDPVKVVAEYRPSELPSPGDKIGKIILETVRNIAHMEEGKIPLALGIRDGSMELKLKIEKEDGRDLVVLKFPK